MKKIKFTQKVKGKMTKFAAISIPILSGTGLVQAATQEEFTNLASAVPYIAFVVIIGIVLIAGVSKK